MKRILLIAWWNPRGISTVIEHISNIKKLSNYKIDVFNAAQLPNRFRNYFPKNISKYSGIIFHNTATYNVEFLKEISKFFTPKLEDFPGFKILMKQDEMRRVNQTKEFIDSWKINAITSCLEPSEAEKVYQLSKKSKLHYMKTYTGYVTQEMMQFLAPPLSSRINDVVYRGMQTPFEWGRLGYEKFEIAESFKKHAAKFNLKMDISNKNEDRLSGGKWIDLLSSSRAALAVESGASIFDFDGSIEAYCQSEKRRQPEITFEQIHKEYLHQFERKIKYNQISPRHIEAAYTRTVQIMYEGEYSGILQAGIHYISLKKDYSNIKEVIDLLKSDEICESMTRKAFKDLILNPDLSYQTFVKNLDQLISLDGNVV